jgi:hypothetical protein
VQNFIYFVAPGLAIVCIREIFEVTKSIWFVSNLGLNSLFSFFIFFFFLHFFIYFFLSISSLFFF